MIAAGKLNNNAINTPTAQPGQLGRVTQPMTNPIANRLMKAALSAARLSGNDIGIIMATETAPKMSPLMIPAMMFDMFPIERARPVNLNLKFRRTARRAIPT